MTWMDAILIYWLLLIRIIAIPGMDMLLVLTHALGRGRRAGFTVVAGIMSAGAVHMVWGTLGTALFLTLPGPVFKMMLLAGAGNKPNPNQLLPARAPPRLFGYRFLIF